MSEFISYVLVLIVGTVFGMSIVLSGISKAKEECQKIHNVQECVLIVTVPKEILK